MSEPLTPLNDNYLELLKRGSVLEQMAAIEIDSLRNSHAALVAENEKLRADYESSMEAIARTIEQALPALQCATCPKQLAHLPDGIRKMVQRDAALAGMSQT